MNELVCPVCGKEDNLEELWCGDGYFHMICNDCDHEFYWEYDE